jgi:hypothetical protein
MLSIGRLFLRTAAFVSLAFASSTHATDLLSGPGTGSTNNSSNNNTLGYEFTVNASPLLLTALGVYRWPGFSSTSVGLWDTSGVLLAQASVDATAGPGLFVFTNLASPILLSPGETYVLGAHYPVGAQLYVNNAGQTSYDSANVTVNHDRYVINAGFAFPSGGETNIESYVGPNARYTVQAVPEPSTVFLFAAGVTALVLNRRRRGSRQLTGRLNP